MVRCLDMMIEQVKVNKKNKLRVMQIIEADLKLLMRILLGLLIAENYENDRIISKDNCGSREGHSIDSAMLEKILIFDLAKK